MRRTAAQQPTKRPPIGRPLSSNEVGHGDDRGLGGDLNLVLQDCGRGTAAIALAVNEIDRALVPGSSGARRKTATRKGGRRLAALGESQRNNLAKRSFAERVGLLPIGEKRRRDKKLAGEIGKYPLATAPTGVITV